MAVKKNAIDILKTEDKEVSGTLVNGFGYDEGRKILGNTAIYSRAVELGFPIGIWIPLERLVQWVRAKITNDERESMSIAHSIRKKIYKEGIEPSLFLLRAIFRVTNSNKL